MSMKTTNPLTGRAVFNDLLYHTFFLHACDKMFFWESWFYKTRNETEALIGGGLELPKVYSFIHVLPDKFVLNQLGSFQKRK